MFNICKNSFVHFIKLQSTRRVIRRRHFRHTYITVTYFLFVFFVWWLIHIYQETDSCWTESCVKDRSINVRETFFKIMAPNGNNQLPDSEFGYTNLRDTELLLKPVPTQNLAGIRILFVTAGFRGPMKFGGISASFFREASFFRGLHANISVLFTTQMKGLDYWIEFYREENIRFIPLPVASSVYDESAWMTRSFDVYLWLKNKQSDFDIIFFHDLHGLALYTLYAKKTLNSFKNVPLVIHAHGSQKLSDYYNARPPHGLEALVVYFMEKKSIELADYVTVPSDFYGDWMLQNDYKIIKGKVFTLQNIVEEEIQLKPLHQHGDIVKSKHFCFFGRIDSLKGAFFFAETLKYMHIKGKKLPEHFTFIGDPVSQSLRLAGHRHLVSSIDYMKEYLADLNKNVTIDFFSNFSTKIALNYMQEHSCIVVNPSFGETSSLVLYESIINGLPVLFSHTRPLTDQVANKLPDQLTFKPGNTKELSSALQYALSQGVPVLVPKVPPDKARKTLARMVLHILTNKHVTLQLTNGIPKYIVTVILTAHGNPHALKNLLTSLLKQTYRYFNILVVDYSSNKEVSETVQKMTPAFQDTSIMLKVFRVPASSLPQARNEGMNLMDTLYGIFIDEEDLAVETMVYMLTYAAIRTSADFVTGLAVQLDENSFRKLKHRRYSLALGEALPVELYKHFSSHSNVLVKKQVYQSVGGYNVDSDGKENPYVDWDLYNRLMIYGYKIEVVPEFTVRSRLNSRTKMAEKNHTYERMNYHGQMAMINNYCKYHDLSSEDCDALKYVKFALS